MRPNINLNILSFLLLQICIVGCSKEAEQTKTDIYENRAHAHFVDSVCVPYKVVNDSSINLNIYHLKNDTATNRPILVYIHGGSWIHGNKSWIWNHYRQAVLEGFVKSHYAVVSVDYRLANSSYNILDELDDCRDALSWIKTHATEYCCDTNRIGLWGTSAGAHLSLLLGNEMAKSIPIRYVIDDYGPTNIDKLLRTDISKIALLAGRIFKPTLVRKRNTMLQVFSDHETELSPVNVITENMPPILISHGSNDGTVPINQAYELVELLKQKGILHKLTIYHGEEHVLNTLSNSEVESHVKRAISFADSCNSFK